MRWDERPCSKSSMALWNQLLLEALRVAHIALRWPFQLVGKEVGWHVKLCLIILLSIQSRVITWSRKIDLFFDEHKSLNVSCSFSSMLQDYWSAYESIPRVLAQSDCWTRHFFHHSVHCSGSGLSTNAKSPAYTFTRHRTRLKPPDFTLYKLPSF